MSTVLHYVIKKSFKILNLAHTLEMGETAMDAYVFFTEAEGMLESIG